MREEAKKGFHQSVPTLHHLLTWTSAPRLLRWGHNGRCPNCISIAIIYLKYCIVPQSQSNIRGVNLSR